MGVTLALVCGGMAASLLTAGVVASAGTLGGRALGALCGINRMAPAATVASRPAAIVRRAVRLVVGEVGEWQKARGAFLAASPDLEGALETLDQEFYRYPDDLERRLSEYLGGWRSGS